MRFRRPVIIDRVPLLRYVVAIVAVGLAVLLNSGLWLLVERPIPSPLFLAVIVLATLIGGWRAGIFASFLSGVAIDYYFVQPYHSIIRDQTEVLRLLLFAIEGAFLSWMVERLQIASDALRRSREELRELGQHQQTVREEEQKRIALEIHDELGQSLTGLKLDVHLVKTKLGAGKSNEVVADLDRLSSHIDGTIGTVRRIAADLRPSVLDDFGLVAALEWQATEFEQRSGVKCVFRTNADEVDLDSDAGSAVFRIFQEAMTNIVRHAGASRVRVSVEELADRFMLRVEDNGCGIDLQQVTRRRSLGILGMRERANRIGATVDIRPGVNGGTLVEVLVPITAA